MRMMPLTRESLDATGCSEPGCAHDHSVLHAEPACHRTAGLDACYIKETGVMEIRCHRCQRPVVAVQVARKGGGTNET